MQPPAAYLESLRPARGKRSSKRDLIVRLFVRQEGHLSADDLVDLVKQHDPRISRATVYRALQWMVDAGLARKVDFGEGRFRFEHAHRHPRHFHLVCKTCNRSFEFLSSDIEALIEEIADARQFVVRQSVLQVHGTCGQCQTGRAPEAEDGTAEVVFARDALRVAIATERSGLEFYERAARLTRGRRGHDVFIRLAGEEREHLATLEARYRDLKATDPDLEARPTFLFFKSAASGLFAAGVNELARGVNDREALLIGIRCEQGSYEFFQRYGERFEDSEGKRIFLEFAEEERTHLEILQREYRALVERTSRGRKIGARSPRGAARG